MRPPLGPPHRTLEAIPRSTLVRAILLSPATMFWNLALWLKRIAQHAGQLAISLWRGAPSMWRAASGGTVIGRFQSQTQLIPELLPGSSDALAALASPPRKKKPKQSAGDVAGENSTPTSSSRFVLSGGQIVGIANTVRKYNESRPVYMHSTPFEKRLEFQVEEERRVAEFACTTLEFAEDKQ